MNCKTELRKCVICGENHLFRNRLHKCCSRNCSKELQRGFRREARRRFRQTPEGKVVKRFENMKRLYRLSKEEYKKFIGSTGGKCYLCGTQSERALCVDHCHKTGEIRKPLCNKCNFLVGIVEKNKPLMVKINSYITEFGK